MTKHYRVKIEYDHWLGAVAAVVLSKFNHGVTGELWGLVRLASSELGWYRNQGLGAPSHTGDGSFVGIVQPGAASVPALLRWLFHVFFFRSRRWWLLVSELSGLDYLYLGRDT